MALLYEHGRVATFIRAVFLKILHEIFRRDNSLRSMPVSVPGVADDLVTGAILSEYDRLAMAYLRNSQNTYQVLLQYWYSLIQYL